MLVQLPEGGIDVASGGLLKASQLEIADAVLRIDDLYLLDARNLDAAAGELQVLQRSFAVAKGNGNLSAFHAAQHVGECVGGCIGRCLAIDGDDQIASSNAAGMCRSAGNDADDAEARFFSLELDAQANEVAFDLRKQLVHLAAGE